jgi:hypothetical protein
MNIGKRIIRFFRWKKNLPQPEYANLYQRLRCEVCGGLNGVWEFEVTSGRDIGVCEECILSGDIDARLKRFVAALESRTRDARALIGRVRVPASLHRMVAQRRAAWRDDDEIPF